MQQGGISAADMTSKKKKRSQQAAVHPVQQVQPQPQMKETIPDVEEDDLPKVEVHTQDTLTEISLLDDSECMPTGSLPVAPTPALAPPRPVKSASASSLPISPAASLGPQYIKGLVAKPQPVPTANVVSSVVDFVHEVLPYGHQQPPSQQPELIEWVDIQSVQKAGDDSKKMDVLILGMARGYQIWTIMENGDCEEVLSYRKGPIRVGKVLSAPPEANSSEVGDRFADCRPLIALVDSSFSQPEKQFCTAMFLSLFSGMEVHRLSMEEPVTALHTSTRYLLINCNIRVVVCDAYTLQEKKSVELRPSPEGITPLSICGSFLAYPDAKLREEFRSCGGADDPSDLSSQGYAEQFIGVAKVWTRSMAGVAAGVQSRSECKGVVTVAHLDSYSKTEEEWIRLHWAAHSEPVAFMMFSPDGRLLMTADTTGCQFRLFLLLPHATTSKLAAVQHLYVLSRGNTPAKVLTGCFAEDSRWVCMATNHGTVHVFAICPYGGPPTSRTHNGVFKNQQSKFTRTAGLSESEHLSGLEHRQRRQSGAASMYREHPSLQRPILARTSGNPRVGPFPPPLLLNAVKKIREGNFSNNLSSWAADLAAGVSSGKRRFEGPKMALSFASRPVKDSQGTSVLVLRANGVLCEYALRPGVGQNTDEAVRVDVIPEASWTLYRTINTHDPPAQQNGPLTKWLRPSVDRPTGRIRTESNRRGEWEHQVEDLCTYSAPARRLWLGPQFAVFYRDKFQRIIQISQSHSDSSQRVPVVIGDGYGNMTTTRVELRSGGVYENSEAGEGDGEIARSIAAAMMEMEQPGRREPETSSSSDEFYYDSPEQKEDSATFDELS